MTDRPDEEEPTEEVIRARFAELPEHVSTQQIAYATFRKPPSVGNWVNHKPDFPPVVRTEGRKHFRDRDAVMTWFFAQSFAAGESRGRKAGSTSRPAGAAAAALTPEQVRGNFGKLPALVTREQIAAATGRTAGAVWNWAANYEDFPPPVDPEGYPDFVPPRTAGRGADPMLRERDAVCEWYLRQPFAFDSGRRGPKDTTAMALAVAPKATRLSVQEITDTLGLREKKTVHNWANNGRPGDPFPPADSARRREWAAVRSWLLRKDDPVPPEDAAADELQDWVARNVDVGGPGTDLEDEHGLTVGQRDAVERARVAVAAGRRVTKAWLSRRLGLSAAAVGRLLDQTGQPAAASRLFPGPLAKELGFDPDHLRHLARYYTEGEDPFPPADEQGHDVAAVRDWLERRALLPSDNPALHTTDAQ